MSYAFRILAAAAAAMACVQVAQAAPSTEDKIDALSSELDQLKAEVAQQKAAAAGGATTLGGYGEINYNSRTIADDATADSNHRLDLRRFVIFLGHRYSDDLHFYSELEIEHAVASSEDKGEVELEQAFIDYRLGDSVNLKTGLFLIPLGILNETHEPPTYYGVERNFVETWIIPSTWREGGIGVYGEVAQGLRYDVGITSGFDSGKIDNPNTGIASAHQELQLANVNDLSTYAALNYLGLPGLRLGGGIFTGHTGQNGATNPLLKDVSARLTLWDLHGQYRTGDLELQAVYARGTLGDADKVSAALFSASADPLLIAPKAFYGWYGQVAYHVWKNGDQDLAPFIRYERYNTQQEVAAGYSANPLNDETVTTAGANFTIHPQVVFKVDYQTFKTDREKNRFDLGVGYMF
jgi:hypothetical protein